MRLAGWLIVTLCLAGITGCSDDFTKPQPIPQPDIITEEIYDYEFIHRQFFYLETPGSNFLNSADGFGTIYPVIGGLDGKDEVEVYTSLRASERGQSGEAEFYLHAYPVPGNGEVDLTENYHEGWFRKLEIEEDYELIQQYTSGDVIRYIGIRLLRSLDTDRALAVCYKSEEVDDNNVVLNSYIVGDYRTDKVNLETSPWIAELICPPFEDFGPDSTISPYPSTWKMMMRNVYSLGSGRIDPDAPFDLRIERNVQDLQGNNHIHKESNILYLRLFGLDRYDRTGAIGKDDEIDNDPAVLNLAYGYVMFPWPEPFDVPYAVMVGGQFIKPSDPDEAGYVDTTLVRNKLIYNKVLSQMEQSQNHFYNIVVEASSGQRTFQLAAFEIIEASEAVTVDGVKLSRGVDYDIDYMSGTVTLKGDILRELQDRPDANVSIDYQHKPLIGGGTSSLLGVGADFNLSRNSRLNATYLYNSVGSPKYAPRLGEEPGRNMAADINGNFQFNPRWMTSLVNILPMVDTDDESSINFGAEVAVSMPNPNVKGEAFIDDMEGIEDSDAINLIRRTWYEASPPIDPADPGQMLKLDPGDQPDFSWFNPSRTDQLEHLVTSRRDLNPGLDTRENSNVTSIFLKAHNPDTLRDDQWFGVMTGFPGGLDLTAAQYLEIWINDYQVDHSKRGGVLHIDFGKIDEDFYQPNRVVNGSSVLNDEDKKPYTWQADEDVGFVDEEGKDPYPGVLNESTWDPAKGVYRGINSRILNGLHDTEDLNRNTRLDTTDTYYSLELRLDDTALVDVQRDYSKIDYMDYWNEKPINNDKAWRMYRLDLSRISQFLVSETGGEPRWDAIQHMRLWVSRVDSLKGVAGPIVEVAGLKLVGNRWEYNGIRDLDGEIIPGSDDRLEPNQNVTVGVINNKENPSLYRPPYSVGTEEGIENREQSLVISVENFADSTSFRAVKRFFGKGQNYQQYRELHFLIHPDDAGNLEGSNFYFQIAYDSLNYYEIEIPITSSMRNTWVPVSINVADLTNLKLVESGDEIVVDTIHDIVDPTRSYIAKARGNPTLFEVRNLYLGIRNTSGHTIPQGWLWFNDIRLGGVKRDIDHAERVSLSANMANVIQLSGQWQRTGPEFRSLRQTQGSGVTNSSWAFSGKSKVNHFIPTLGFELPFSARLNSSTAFPKYVPRSDVEIADEEIRVSQRSVNNSQSYNISMSRRGSKNIFMKTFFDNLKMSYTYSKKNIFTPNTRDTTLTHSGNLNYRISFARGRELGLFKGIKWRYWLSNFSLVSSASRQVRFTHSLTGDKFVRRPVGYGSGLDNSISTLYEPFESIKIDFDLKEHRDRAIDHYILGIPVGVQTSFNHSFRFNFQPGGNFFLLSEFRPRIDYTSRYNEDLRPSIRQEVDPFGTRNVSTKRDMSFVFDVDVGKYSLAIGRFLRILEPGEGAVRRTSKRSSAMDSREDRERRIRDSVPDAFKSPTGKGTGEPERFPGAVPDRTEPPEQPPPTPPAREEEPEPKEEESQRDLGIPQRQVDVTTEEDKEPKEEEKAAEPDTAAAARTDPMLLFKEIFKLLGRIEPVKASMNTSRQSSYQRLYERASLGYQFGLTDKSGVTGRSGTVENKPERASNNFVLDLRSGIGLTSTIDLDVRYNFTNTESNYGGTVTQTERVTWPSLNLSWGRMENSRFLKKFIKQSDLKVNFEKQKSSDVRRVQTSYLISPNWSFTWKNDLTTNVGVSYKHDITLDKGQEIWTKSWGVTFNMKYNFQGTQGFGIPLPFLGSKKIKFKSTLTTDLGVSYTNLSRYNQREADNTLSIAPRASYRFSKKINGTVSMNYTRNTSGLTGYVNHSLGLHFTADFTF